MCDMLRVVIEATSALLPRISAKGSLPDSPAPPFAPGNIPPPGSPGSSPPAQTTAAGVKSHFHFVFVLPRLLKGHEVGEGRKGVLAGVGCL